MNFRWKQGTGQPPKGAIIVSNNNLVVWQVLQYLEKAEIEGVDNKWVDIKLVFTQDL
ncbi:MAG: hypothetical protein ABFS03_00785 [Chloroflexota bacterium]